MIRLRVLGTLELHDAGGRELRAVVAQPRRLGLLTYLAAATARGYCRRDTLLGLFWPELDEPHARAALNQALRFLRKSLGDESQSIIVSRGAEEVGVDPAQLWCDASAYREHVAARRWAEALDLYRGELLAGFFLDAADGFEKWLELERAAFRAGASQAARLLAEQREAERRYSEALVCARRAADLADLDELRVRELLALLDRLGDRAGALRVFDQFATRLANDYGAEPSPETKALIERIRARSTAGAPTAAEAAAIDARRSATGQTTIEHSLPAAKAAGPRRRRGMRTLAALLGGAAVLVAAAAVPRVAGVGPFATLFRTGEMVRDEQLLVTDLPVTGADSTLSAAVSLATRTALTRSRAIRVMSRESMADALRRMKRPPATAVDAALGREIAQREGIRVLVDGQVVRTGRAFAIGMRLLTVDSATELATVQATAQSTDEIIPVVDAVARKLRARIGESLRDVRSTPPLPREVTSSIEALRSYAASLREYDPPKSIAFLKDAVRADSEFAMAWRRLWIMYANIGIGGPTSDSALVRAARYSPRLPELERQLVMAAYHTSGLFADSRRSKAVAIYQRLADSGQRTSLVNLPEVIGSRREFARAESLQIANIRRMPDFAGVREGAVHMRVELGKLDAAEAMLDSSLRRIPTHWPLQWWKVRLLYLRGDLDRFARALDSLRALPDPARRLAGTRTSASLALLEGRLREWTRLRAETRTLAVAAGGDPGLSDVLDEASVDLALRHDSARAVHRVQAALRGGAPKRAPQVSGIAGLFARAGRPDLARRLLAQYVADVDSIRRQKDEFFEHRILAQIAIAEGRGADAVIEVRRGDVDEDGPAQSCFICYYRDLAFAFDRAHETDSAIVYFERFVEAPSVHRLTADPITLNVILRRLGELYETTGRRDRAIHYYARFVELWRRADPELQPQMTEIRRRIDRLTKADRNPR